MALRERMNDPKADGQKEALQEMKEKINHVRVLARSSPEDKLQLVRLLKVRGGGARRANVGKVAKGAKRQERTIQYSGPWCLLCACLWDYCTGLLVRHESKQASSGLHCNRKWAMWWP